MRRIYLDPSDCEKTSNIIYVKGNTFHYLARVLRMKTGDTFLGFDGSGNEYEISVKKIDTKLLEGNILKKEKMTDTELSFNISLFQCLPKGSKMDRIIGDIAQLGVKKVYPVISSRVIPHITVENQNKKGRWKRIAAESSKIAGRDVVMEIENPVEFKEAVKINSDIKLIFWEKSSIPLRNAIKNIPELKNGTSVNVFIGPEGGFTDEEVALAEKYGVVSVSMGKRILKVETAAVIAVALTIYELENMNTS